ncbi:MAG: dUTP diphosphatase [Sphingobacteriales bacterium]|nr:MAG: dUTP diphosphatase [Sphingobacteriales bacterium]
MKPVASDTPSTLVINQSPHPLPAYQTAGAAGMDICAWLPEPVTLQPLERAAIPTGLYMALPTGTELQVRPRSGLAMKHGVTVLNSPGTIDADYRGELRVLLVNLSAEPYTIQDGDRIAQLVLARYELLHWECTDALPETSRGNGGFGSTGFSHTSSSSSTNLL